jgi:hypothetical protein
MWMSLSEQALSDRRVGWPSSSPRSMAASSALLMVCASAVEVTRILGDVREDGWVAARPLGGWSALFRSRPCRQIFSKLG